MLSGERQHASVTISLQDLSKLRGHDVVCCAQIDFPGKMYITDRQTCFAASSGSVSFSLPHKAKQTVQKLLQGVGSGDHLSQHLTAERR